MYYPSRVQNIYKEEILIMNKNKLRLVTMALGLTMSFTMVTVPQVGVLRLKPRNF